MANLRVNSAHITLHRVRSQIRKIDQTSFLFTCMLGITPGEEVNRIVRKIIKGANL